MKHPKQLPPVAAMILLSAGVILFLLIAPDADTIETRPQPLTVHLPIRQRESRLLHVELREPKKLDRWEKFEAEFGIAADSNPPLLNPLREAKYQADVTIFTVNTVLHRLEDLLELRYSNGRIGRSATFQTPSPNYLRHAPLTFEDARLKFDFDFVSGKPYLGIRLVLPFGN